MTNKNARNNLNNGLVLEEIHVNSNCFFFQRYFLKENTCIWKIGNTTKKFPDFLKK